MKKITYSEDLIQAIKSLDQKILDLVLATVCSTLQTNQTIFFAGNGGSASTSSHMAADLGKNARGTNTNQIKTISLSENTAWITAVGNDISFDDIFMEQLKNLSSPSDLLIVYSCSGNSKNILKAVKWAKKQKLTTIGLLGCNGGKVANIVDLALIVKSNNYGIIETTHSYINHYIVENIKEKNRV